jgi:hypothetical protein
MRRSTKIFLVGLALSLLIFGVGKLNTHRLAGRERQLQAACEATNTTTAAQVEVPKESVPPGANVFDQFDDPPPLWTLAYIRNKYPQYRDLTDQELAQKIHDKYPGRMVCDPETLLALDQPSSSNTGRETSGIQARIADARNAKVASESWPLPVAIAVLGLFSVPWLWYAVLRRLAELRAAIGGNPPTG